MQFGGVNLVCVGSGARQLATFRRLNSPSVNLVIGSTPGRTGRVVCHRYGYRLGLTGDYSIIIPVSTRPYPPVVAKFGLDAESSRNGLQKSLHPALLLRT